MVSIFENRLSATRLQIRGKKILLTERHNEPIAGLARQTVLRLLLGLLMETIWSRTAYFIAFPRPGNRTWPPATGSRHTAMKTSVIVWRRQVCQGSAPLLPSPPPNTLSQVIHRRAKRAPKGRRREAVNNLAG